MTKGIPSDEPGVEPKPKSTGPSLFDLINKDKEPKVDKEKDKKKNDKNELPKETGDRRKEGKKGPNLADNRGDDFPDKGVRRPDWLPQLGLD